MASIKGMQNFKHNLIFTFFLSKFFRVKQNVSVDMIFNYSFSCLFAEKADEVERLFIQ